MSDGIKIILFLLVLGFITKYWIWFAVPIGLILAFKLLAALYRELNPEAKKSYLDKKAKEAEENRLRKEQAEAEAKEKREREEAERQKKEFERQQHRDGDQQETPYTYQIGKHGNESLAIRYGIANQERKVKEYWYYAKGGEQKRNPDRDKVYYEPANKIRLQKTRKVSKDLYEVLLTDFRDRKARAVIETGTEYVKTFYPIDDSWFEKYADLEETLKGNNSFTLKELATFHIQKAVGT